MHQLDSVQCQAVCSDQALDSRYLQSTCQAAQTDAMYAVEQLPENHLYLASNHHNHDQVQQQQLRVTEDGRSLRVQADLPHLVSLGGGRLSTAVTLLPLPEGKTMIGTSNASQPQDIVVKGAGIQDQHAYIINQDDVVTLYPLSDQTFVDGTRITNPTRMPQGCMLCFGRSTYFRFNNPIEAQRLKRTGQGNALDRYSMSDNTGPVYDTPRKWQDESGIYDNTESCASRKVSPPSECDGPGQHPYENVDTLKKARVQRMQERNQQQQTSRRSRRQAHTDSLSKNEEKAKVAHDNEDLLDQTSNDIASPTTNEAVSDNQLHSRRASIDAASTVVDSGSDGGNWDRKPAVRRGGSLDESSTLPPELAWNGYDNVTQLKEAIVASAAAKLASGMSGFNVTPTKRSVKFKTDESYSISSVVPDTEASASVKSSAVGDRTMLTTKFSKTSSTSREPTTAAHGEPTISAEITQGFSPSTTSVDSGSRFVPDTSSSSLTRQLHTDAGPVSTIDRKFSNTAEKLSSPKYMTNVDLVIPAGTTFSPVSKSTSDETQLRNEIPNGREIETSMKAVELAKDEAKTGAISKEVKVSSKSLSLKFGWKSPKSTAKVSKNCKEKPPIGKASIGVEKVSTKLDKRAEDEPRKECELKSRSPTEESPAVVKVEPSSHGSGKMSFIRSILIRARSPSPKRVSTSLSGKSKVNGRSVSPSPVSTFSSTTSSFAKRLSDPLRVSLRRIMAEGSKSSDASKQTKDKKQQLEQLQKRQPQAPEKPKRQQQHQPCQTIPSDNVKQPYETFASVSGTDSGIGSSSSSSLVTSETTSKSQCDDDNGDSCQTSRAYFNVERSALIQPSWTDNHSTSTLKNDSKTGCRLPVVAGKPQLIVGDVGNSSGNACGVTTTTPKVVSKEIVSHSNVETMGEAASFQNKVESVSTNPWIVNIKEVNLVPPNLENFRGEKVFQKGTATTCVTLPGFERTTQDNAKTSAFREGLQPCDENAFSRRNSSPIYDTVYVERSAKASSSSSSSSSATTVTNSSTMSELGFPYGGCRTLGRFASLPPEAVLDEVLKVSNSRKPDSNCVVEPNLGHANLLNRDLIRETGIPAVVGRRFERTIGAILNSSDASGTRRGKDSLENTQPSKIGQIRTTRLASADNSQQISPTSASGLQQQSTDTMFSSAAGATSARTSTTRLANRPHHLELPTKCSAPPQNSRQPATAPALMEFTAGDALPSTLWQPYGINGEYFDELFHDRSRRDLVTASIVDDDLSASQRDLADLYRKQKSEREREQELARREKERWEKIEMMWRDFEVDKSQSATVAPSSISCGNISDQSEEPSASSLRKNVSADVDLENYAMRPCSKPFARENRDSEPSMRLTARQIDKSLDDLLDEFNLTVALQLSNGSETTRHAQQSETTSTVDHKDQQSMDDEGTSPPTTNNGLRPRQGQGQGDDSSSTSFGRPRASSCTQRPAASESTQTIVDKNRSRTILEQKLCSNRAIGLTSRSTFDLETGRQTGNRTTLEDTSSGSDIDAISSSLSSSTFMLTVNHDDTQTYHVADVERTNRIEDQLKQIQEHLRRKQIAIESLELEKQRCLDLERKLQEEMKSGVQFKEDVDESAVRGLEADAVMLRPRHRDVSAEETETISTRPLTRYLPTRSAVLDLRQFVESSGHNLAQSGLHVEVTSSSCRGFLSKMGGHGLRKWNRRWFVFDRLRRCIVYYADRLESTRAARATINFRSITDVFVDHLQSVRGAANSNAAFCVKTSERTLYLLAPTPEVMRIWVDVIFTGAEGYQQFT